MILACIWASTTHWQHLIVTKGLVFGIIIRELLEPFVSLVAEKDCSWKVDEPNNQKQDFSSTLTSYLVIILDPTLVKMYSRISST